MGNVCEGRVAIITGAGGGLGAAHARIFAAQGGAVVVNDINRDNAQAVVDEIVANGGRAVVNHSDITHYQQSSEAVEQAIASFGDLHAVINNAGINRDRMFASMEESDWDAIMAVHLKGHFCISSHAVKYSLVLPRIRATAHAMAASVALALLRITRHVAMHRSDA